MLLLGISSLPPDVWLLLKVVLYSPLDVLLLLEVVAFGRASPVLLPVLPVSYLSLSQICHFGFLKHQTGFLQR